MAVLVMLNNYMHDLATAVFAVSAIAAYLLLRSRTAEEAPSTIRPVAEGLVKIGMGSLIWTLAGGALENDEGPTKKVHTNSKKFNLAGEGYEAVW